MITVLTPTYNRAKYLGKAYESLLSQSDKNFEWIIVDDGSTDDTKKYVTKIQKENKIKIKYFYKENGGKHTALNLGTKEANGDLLLVLDSDDMLSANAIETIHYKWKKYEKKENICGMTFLKKLNNSIYKSKSFDECISNVVDFKYNKNHLQDMCEVVRTNILKKHPYPVFDNENFLSEIIIYNEISKQYDMVYIPIEIYIAEYLDDGLSKSWLKLVVNNPKGARANSLRFMNNKNYKLRIRLKNCLTYGVYSIIAKEKIIRESEMKLISTVTYFPCLLIAKYLEKKYKKRSKEK